MRLPGLVTQRRPTPSCPTPPTNTASGETADAADVDDGTSQADDTARSGRGLAALPLPLPAVPGGRRSTTTRAGDRGARRRPSVPDRPLPRRNDNAWRGTRRHPGRGDRVGDRRRRTPTAATPASAPRPATARRTSTASCPVVSTSSPATTTPGGPTSVSDWPGHSQETRCSPSLLCRRSPSSPTRR